MGKNFALFLGILALILIFNETIETYAQTDGDSSITIKTDANNYGENDIIVISGTVPQILPDTPILLQILSQGKIIDITQFFPAKDGTYSHTIIAEKPIWNKPGEYLILVAYGQGNLAETTVNFTNSESNKDDPQETEQGNEETADIPQQPIKVIMDKTLFSINSSTQIVRATVEFLNYSSSDGHYFMKVTHLPTGKVLKDVEIYPKETHDGLWAVQIAYPFLESDLNVDGKKLLVEFEIQIRSQNSPNTGSAKFSIVDYWQEHKSDSVAVPVAPPVSSPKPETILESLTDSEDSNNKPQKIPEWIKNTMGWYADGLISEDELISAIKFLIQERIIILD